MMVEDRETRQTNFLMAYSSTGIISEACRDTGIDRKTVRNWQENDPVFAEAMAEVHEDVLDTLRSQLRLRAFGYQEPLTYQGRKTGDTIEKYSERVLVFLAQTVLPEAKTQHHSVEVTDVSDIRERFLEKLSIMAERMRAEDDANAGDDGDGPTDNSDEE